jgi:hypothetical protein
MAAQPAESMVNLRHGDLTFREPMMDDEAPRPDRSVRSAADAPIIRDLGWLSG